MIQVTFKSIPQKKQNGIYTKNGFIPFEGDYFYSLVDFKGVEGEVKFTLKNLTHILINPSSEQNLTNWVAEGLRRFIKFKRCEVYFGEPYIGDSEVNIHFKVHEIEQERPPLQQKPQPC